ncbi:ATP-binding cassette domain-containing protein [Echinicola soli]|uniref:ATP-binding cassette domain-containing protein n=1 Tax=Echinicola soli TaxID=2591634 RepID=A0A514CKE2_9BACT|nr:ATP-binding cassette domain-containing protein [Echinicola soli]QDH80293.1 ATP-binding cassette domain-containing protein [Echinicola soli]
MIDLKLRKSLTSDGTAMVLDIQLNIAQGQFITLFGSSGSGKTSTLRMISGLMTPDEGHLLVKDKSWFDASKSIHVSPGKRKLGYLFQDYALFPNMTVKENIAFALADSKDTVFLTELLESMDLVQLQDFSPAQLSGGQQQRVALARALAVKPEILLLDEPLSALDHSMREKLQEYILSIHRKYSLTTILVSHDVSEIIKLSDLLIELDNGKIRRKCTPREFFGAGLTSAKFQFQGEIIAIHDEDVVHIIHVKIGSELVKVVCDIDETKNLTIGDKVMVGSKAFNPLIKKI